MEMKILLKVEKMLMRVKNICYFFFKGENVNYYLNEGDELNNGWYICLEC